MIRNIFVLAISVVGLLMLSGCDSESKTPAMAPVVTPTVKPAVTPSPHPFSKVYDPSNGTSNSHPGLLGAYSSFFSKTKPMSKQTENSTVKPVATPSPADILKDYDASNGTKSDEGADMLRPWLMRPTLKITATPTVKPTATPKPKGHSVIYYDPSNGT